MKNHSLLICLASLALAPAALCFGPLGTAFTYQGRLIDGAGPATGLYDLKFSIYESDVFGGPVESVIRAPVPVTNGLFTVTLDFGDEVFFGFARWLEIAVRTNGSPDPHTALAPLQPITAAPYALHAINAQSLMSFVGGPMDLTIQGVRALRLEIADGFFETVNLVGGFAGNTVSAGVYGATIAGGGMGSVANRVEGNFGAIGGGAGNTASGSGAVVGGGFRNTASGFREATIAGGHQNIASGSGSSVGGGVLNTSGGDNAVIAGGAYNTINADASAVGGGQNNVIAAAAAGSTVAGGQFNDIGTNSGGSSIGGGYDNNIDALSSSSTIAGGGGNAIRTSSSSSAIGGGSDNTIGASSHQATIAGGFENDIRGDSGSSTISGGSSNEIGDRAGASTIAGGGENEIGTNSIASAIGGGSNNRIAVNSSGATISGGGGHAALGSWATIPGGASNAATNSAFAAGTRAKANHTGAFVWGDSTSADIASTNANSVTFRAAGGTRLFSDANATAGVFLAPGSGSWTSMSDRHAKENLQPVDSREVLERVTRLPVQTWNYKSQDAAVRHLGPMAQDFKAAFGLGESDTGITTVDADGVALAAIQGLNQKLAQELEHRDAENAALRQRLARLEALMSRIAGKKE